MALGPLALGTGIEPAGLPYGNQLSYLTRRSFLAKAYSQIYNTSPTVVGLYSNAVEEVGGVDNIMANVQYQQMVQPAYSTFTANFAVPQPVAGIQPAAWAYSMIVVPIPIYLNEIMLQDEQKIQDLVELRMTDAGNATRDFLGNSLFTNASNALEFYGLNWAIDDGTNNANWGQLPRSNSWWQSRRFNVGGALTRSTLLTYIVATIKQQGEKPDFGIVGPMTWALLSNDFLPLERYSPNQEKTDQYMSAFTALEVMGVPIYMDPYCPEGLCYLPNTNYITMRVHKMANWEFIDFQSMVPAYNLNYTGVVLLLSQLINTKPSASSMLYNITGYVNA